MCCFSQPTTVSSTSIFARYAAPSRQLVAYRMQYTAERPTAMILPLPVALPAGEASVAWRDLKAYPHFFEDLDRGFPAPPPSRFTRSKSVAAAAAPQAIAVHEVGDFIASFVPNVADFDRLDPQFSIRKDIWAQIPEYRDYGFAVFQLKKLSGSPHPIAFEFHSRMADKLFFPTVHIHDGTVHAEEHFDHALYMQDARFDAQVGDYAGPDEADKRTGYVRSNGKVAAFANVGAAAGVLDGDLLVHRSLVRGLRANKDTLVELVSARASAASGCGRCAAFAPGGKEVTLAGPSSAALLAFAWIVRRRNLLRAGR